MTAFTDLLRERLNEPPFELTAENSDGVPHFETWMHYVPGVPSDRPHVVVLVEDWTLDTYERYIEYAANLAARMNAGMTEGIETWATLVIPQDNYHGDLHPEVAEQRAQDLGFDVTVWEMDENGEFGWERDE